MYIRRKARTKSTEIIRKNKYRYACIRLVPFAMLLIFWLILFDIFSFSDNSMYSKIGIGTKFDAHYNYGDVVILNINGNESARRIIGLPGDNIEINYDSIFINGKKVTEKYYLGPTYSSIRCFQVPSDSIFVLADNRMEYQDSREYGSIKISNIKEKIIFLL